MRKQKRHSPEERKQWVARLRASGLSGRAFAQRHGLPLESVYRWSREFPAGEEMPAKATFAEVRVRGVADEHSRIDVVLKNGRVLRLHGDIDARRVRSLIEVLESC